MYPLPLLLLALSAFSVATADTFRTHHRIHHVELGHLPYSEHGTVHVADDGDITFTPAPSLAKDLDGFSNAIAGLTGPLDSLYYQVALQRGDGDQSLWDFTSVKACHLPHADSQTIILHTQATKPFAIDYFLSPIPPDASCPKTSRSKSSVAAQSPFAAFAANLGNLNTTVLLKSPNTPPLPQLRKPQPVAPTGQPIEPVPEKSFLQKYWMYIAVAFVALLLTGGEEEGPRRQARA